MAIARLHRTLSRTLITLGVISLAACGGGGGGKKQEPAPDTTPNAYSYTATTNAEPSTVITSAPVTITGINAATPVSITGGEYSINGGAFTSAAGTVTSGQTITIRLTAPAANSTSASAQITVGGVAATFTVTTKADTTPDAFAFTAQINAALNTEYTSNTITVTGIDAATPVSVTGGTYSINGGAFTAAAGTVSVNNTVAVKATSASDTEQTRNVVLTIGGVSATYSITTIADTTPPVAEFKFPTPYTMSEANTVKVRGTATDDHAITSVKVVVNGTTEIDVTPKSEVNGVKDFSSWTATIPLTVNTENEIKVIAVDDRGNTIGLESAKKVVVRQRVDYSGVFPDTGSVVGTTSGLVLDKQRNRLFYASQADQHKISEIDISTGSSKVFADFTEQGLRSFAMGVIDQNNEYVYFPLTGAKTILKVNLDNPNDYSAHENEAYGYIHRAITLNNTGDIPRLISARKGSAPNSGGIVSTWLDSWTASVLSDASLGIPDSTISFDDTSALVFDQKNNRYLVSGSEEDAVIAIDAINGMRSVLSSEVIGSGDAYGMGDTGLIKTIALDEPRNRLIVLEIFTGNIFAVDLDTAQRSIISQMTLAHPTSNIWPNNEKNYIGAEIDTENELLYTVHHRVRALMVVDLQSGQQLILSKAANE